MKVYHDGSCPICAAEVAALGTCSMQEKIEWIDCAPKGFSLQEGDAPNQTALLQALHLQDAKGTWHVGVDAFALLYKNTGHHRIAAILRFPPTRFLARLAYPLLLKTRPYLSHFSWVIKLTTYLAGKK